MSPPLITQEKLWVWKNMGIIGYILQFEAGFPSRQPILIPIYVFLILMILVKLFMQGSMVVQVVFKYIQLPVDLLIMEYSRDQ
jgi:hypothetical protein